jgi:hypothetical protein
LLNYTHKKGWDLKTLNIETWRNDKVLRECVIGIIISQNQPHFTGLSPQYELLRELQRSLQ